MSIVADTHVHIYPCHSAAKTFRAATESLGRLADKYPGSQLSLCLTERYDCDYFSRLEGDDNLAGEGVDAVRRDESCFELQIDGRSLFLFAGRQLVSSERVELLSLLSDNRIDDGQPLKDLLGQVRESGGIPVLSWAPGKWFGDRGKLIKSVLDRADEGSLLIGDTSLRPTVWTTPRLMAYAKQQRLGRIAGSDPLPFPGEECQCGRYASLLEGNISPDSPTKTMREALMRGAVKQIGKRNGPLQMLLRLKNNQAVRASVLA